MASMMLLKTVLNASVGPTKVLLATRVGVVLGVSEEREKVVVGSGPEGYDTVNLISDGLERLVGGTFPAVGTGTGEGLSANSVFLLEVIAD